MDTAPGVIIKHNVAFRLLSLNMERIKEIVARQSHMISKLNLEASFLLVHPEVHNIFVKTLQDALTGGGYRIDNDYGPIRYREGIVVPAIPNIKNWSPWDDPNTQDLYFHPYFQMMWDNPI